MGKPVGAWSSHELLPLYYRVESAIERRIQDGELGRGARLPSEATLARQFRVSRLTVREAMRRLAEQGYVTRVRGRGTFVAERLKDRVASTKFTGRLEDYYAEIQQAQVKSAQILELAPPARVREALQLAPGARAVMVRRVRFVDGLPFAVTVNWMPGRYGRRLREADLYRMPLVQIFEQKLHVTFGDAQQTIEAKFAADEVAEALEVPFGAPVLYVERLMRDRTGAPVELVMSNYRADRYRYTATLVRSRGGAFRWQYKTEP